MPTQIGLSTIIKWSQLDEVGLKRAMKGRRKGGAINPHDRLYALIRAYAGQKMSARDVFRAINKVENIRRRKSFRNGFKNFLRSYGDRTWQLHPSSRLSYNGALGVLQIRVMAHITLSTETSIYRIILWNNDEPRLTRRAALIGALLLSEVYGRPDKRQVRYEVADLKSGVCHCIDLDKVDELIGDLSSFLSSAEAEYRDIAA